ncbi:MAG TPA: hypothetical protein VLD62_03315 [Acidimicrobiia bacterium]|nr:hypothetical protein [Acidimicrobiia bacterium]
MNDRGSTTPLVLAILVGGALLMAVTVDLGRLAATHTEAQRAARAGAEAGAAVVSVEAAYQGRLEVDPVRAGETAQNAALAARPRGGRSATVAADRTSVCVRVRQVFEPGPARAVGARATVVTATACASPRSG